MDSVINILTGIFTEAISAAFPDITDAPIVIVPADNPKFGDYQCNSVMKLVSIYKQAGPYTTH